MVWDKEIISPKFPITKWAFSFRPFGLNSPKAYEGVGPFSPSFNPIYNSS